VKLPEVNFRWEALYEHPLGPAQANNPRVYFDVAIGINVLKVGLLV
jgi:hypothetical protein